MQLENKVALITGSAQGLGMAMAWGMAKEGAKIIITDINSEKGKTTAEELKESGYFAEFVYCNVLQKRDVEFLISESIKIFNKIDILVNNAGLAKIGAIDAIKEEDWDICIGVDVKGVFLCTQEVVKVMKKQNSGCIINISSIHGLQGMPERGPYSVAKAGVVNFTATLAAELGRWNIRVNCIAPGFNRTQGFEEQVAKGTVKPEELESRIPLGRIGQPEDIADAVIFLASDKSKYITGVTIPVDGGWLADGGRGMARPSENKT
ncbi:MAG: SDR family oxidoreductase [Actinobacteria bacterium]|nr:SDR family oxidoreductase [Actinomycetota bacterium]